MSDTAGILMGLAGVITVVGFIILSISLVLYILYSVGLYKLAKNRGMSNCFIAWIPVVRSFMLGAIVDDIEIKRSGKGYWRFIFLGGCLFNSFFAGMPKTISYLELLTSPEFSPGIMSAYLGAGLFAALVSIAIYVLELVLMYKIFQQYRPESNVLFTVLGAIPVTMFLRYIFIFVVRNDNPGDMSEADPDHPYSSGTY